VHEYQMVELTKKTHRDKLSCKQGLT